MANFQPRGSTLHKKVTIRPANSGDTAFEIINPATNTATMSVTTAGQPSFTGAQTFQGGATVSANQTLAVTTADKLTVGGVIVPQHFYVTFNVPAGAAAADYDGNIPIPDAAMLVSVTERHQTAGNDAGSVTLMVKKTPSGTAKASGTDCLSAGINLKAAADTNQSGTLHGTPANYTFAAGDAVSLVTTGTLTTLDGVSVTCKFKRV